VLQGGNDVTDFVRPSRKTKPAHRIVRQYTTSAVLETMAVEKPLPEKVWQSVKKAVGIEGTFIPEGR
jgi:hypothetical protein